MLTTNHSSSTVSHDSDSIARLPSSEPLASELSPHPQSPDEAASAADTAPSPVFQPPRDTNSSPSFRQPSQTLPTTVHHTPVKVSPSSHKLPYKDPHFNSKIRKAMQVHYAELEFEKFLETFTPSKGSEDGQTLVPSGDQLLSSKEKLECLRDAAKEADMYEPLCASFNETVHPARSNRVDGLRYVFKAVGNHPESGYDDLKIDIAMYPTTEQAQLAYQLSTKKLRGRQHLASTAWAWITCGVEVKIDPARSAFSFDDSPTRTLLRDTPLGKDSQAQIAKYATEIMIRQHRTFVFLVYILGSKARVTRWDRAGCIVSTPVDFMAKPETLLTFIHRLALMTDEELGYDTTAVLAAEDEVKELENRPYYNLYAESLAKEILDNRILFPIYKVSCLDLNKRTSSFYYIGKHSTASRSPIGRATKGYVAFRASNPLLCFLKDYWRPNLEGMRSELDVYAELVKHQVRNVATALGGGDVEGQTTITQDYLNVKGLLKRLHCIVVIEQLARPLEDYRNSSEMILLVYDALRGHKEAWEAGVLHRDISIHNIMNIVDQKKKISSPHGILIDWDLAKFTKELTVEATQHGRSGTWRFMSALSLQYPYKPNSLADDLESFIHVVTLCGLRFHHHTMTNHYLPDPDLQALSTMEKNAGNELLAQHVWDYYDQSAAFGKVYVGGRFKLQANGRGDPDFSFIDDNVCSRVSSRLISLVALLYGLLKEYYNAIDHEALKQYSPRSIRKHVSAIALSPAHPVSPLFSDRQKTGRKKTSSIPVAPAAASRKPTTGTSHVFDSHERVLEVFEDIVDLIVDDDQQGKTLDDKTEDQFLGLPSFAAALPKGASGSKRTSASAVDGDYVSKRSRLDNYSSIAESLKEVEEHYDDPFA